MLVMREILLLLLLRNNVRLIGRSFKYHRPRGIYTCGIEEPNALVQIINEHNEPNVKSNCKKNLRRNDC